MPSTTTPSEPWRPDRDCALCPRLRTFREAQRKLQPSWHNAPVPAFGAEDAPLLVVGLAPGLRGANRTGRPFTGDYAGDLLYPALLRQGLGRGRYTARPDDGVELTGCRITNAVRCVPPANKPTPAETTTCRRFLGEELRRFPPSVILALGRIAHDSTLRTIGLSPSRHPFAHGRVHELPSGQRLVACYHPSRYNVNTGVLTAGMLDEVLEKALRLLGEPPPHRGRA